MWVSAAFIRAFIRLIPHMSCFYWKSVKKIYAWAYLWRVIIDRTERHNHNWKGVNRKGVIHVQYGQMRLGRGTQTMRLSHIFPGENKCFAVLEIELNAPPSPDVVKGLHLYLKWPKNTTWLLPFIKCNGQYRTTVIFFTSFHLFCMCFL